MTNAEKFKEFFGFENGDTNTCPYKDCIDKDSENYDSCYECIEAYWRSEYQGEPTIPLSVIEDIKTYVHNYIIISESEEEKLIGYIDRKIAEVTKNE